MEIPALQQWFGLRRNNSDESFRNYTIGETVRYHNMKGKSIILNLVSVFVAAFGLTTFLHEFAHAIVAKMVGVESILFHSYVSLDNSTTPSIHQIYIL